MATYASLTATQKEHIRLYDLFMRGVVSSLAHVAKQSNAASMNAFAVTNVDSVIASLDVGEVIPNSSDLAGSSALTKAEFLALQAILRTLQSTLATNIALLVKAAGVNV